MQYLIQCKFPDVPEQFYIGTYDELNANIRNTWSKVPHRVHGAGFMLYVTDDKTGRELATFTTTPIERLPLPWHF